MTIYTAFVRFDDGRTLSLATRFSSDRTASLEASELARQLKARGEPVIMTGWYIDDEAGGVFPLAMNT